MTQHPFSSAPTHDTNHRSASDDRGDTLIEILIALIILSGTVVALLTAFSTSISASSEYRGLVVTDTVLRTVSEQVIGMFQQGNTFQPCATATLSQYQTLLTPALVVPAPYASAPYIATVSGVQFWDGAGYGNSCTDGVPQLITITLSGPLSVTRTTSFVVEGTGQIFSNSAVQLAPPTGVTTATPSGDSGGLAVSFVNSTNAPANSVTFTQYYTVEACTNGAMTQGCTPVADQFQSGNELQGLVPGTPYWVTVYANASPGYLASAATSPVSGTSSGTLSQPEILSVTSSTTTAGAVNITFTPPSGAPFGESYSATGCTDAGMSNNCVTIQNFTSGSQLAGLTPGTSYYVQIIAPSNGVFLGSTSPVFAPPVIATQQLTAPSVGSVTSSQLQTGALVVTFSGSTNAPATQSYSVTGCTDAAMTIGCVTQSAFTYGSQFTGLVAGTKYYVTVTAVASTAYLAATSAPTTSSVEATIQLTQPSITRVQSGSTTGTIKVRYTGSSNAPRGTTYTLIACTNTAMTLGCVTNPNYASNTSVGTWATGVTVYVTVGANASPGYLASIPSAQSSGTAG